MEYLGLSELAADEELFAESLAPLRDARPEVRINVYRKLFDFMRQGMAVRAQV